MSCLFQWKAAVETFKYYKDIIDTSLFTSVSKLEQLARTEQTMVTKLGIYIHDSDSGGIEVPENVKRFYKELLDVSSERVEAHFMENPINAFHFIHRMHVTWPGMIAAVDCEHCTLTVPLRDFRDSLFAIEEQSQIDIRASVEDLQWAAVAIARLWHTYKLHLPSLFRGQILNVSTNPLSFDDILYICKQLDIRNEFYKEIIWLEALSKEMTNRYFYADKDLDLVIRSLAAVYSKYGMTWISVDLLEKQVALADSNAQSKLKRDLEFYTSKLKDVSVNERNTQLGPSETDLAKSHYEALCRGHVTRKQKILSRLRCIYRKTLVPILRAKEEILSYDPRLSLFHGVLTDKEIIAIKDKAASMLKASKILGFGNKRNIPEFNFRVSQTAWLDDDDSEVVKHVSNRIELITGLITQQLRSFSNAENLQVLNYGVGGMYEAHLDYFSTPIHVNPTRADDPVYLRGTGDRIATWMFYLNDVTAGGATVFLNLNITVPVEKGAAVFWYNIKRNGELDTRTIHAGCPVLIGSKWVANKWIRQHGQIFRRKCGLKINSIDIPL